MFANRCPQYTNHTKCAFLVFQTPLLFDLNFRMILEMRTYYGLLQFCLSFLDVILHDVDYAVSIKRYVLLQLFPISTALCRRLHWKNIIINRRFVSYYIVCSIVFVIINNVFSWYALFVTSWMICTILDHLFLTMCMCVCVYMYVYVGVCMYVCMNGWMRVCVCKGDLVLSFLCAIFIGDK